MGKGQRQYRTVTEHQWDDISKAEEKGKFVLNEFVPLPEIQLDGLDFEKISDADLIASFGEKNVEENGRTAYPFAYLCHGTTKDEEATEGEDQAANPGPLENRVVLIEREGLRASKGSSSHKFDDCYFTWWHLYPHDFIYNSPDDEGLKESNRKKRERLLENVVDADNRKTLENLLIKSAMFRVKLFPFITHNFIASIADIIEEYKTIMGCEEIEMKKYGTFVYFDPYKRTKYLREVMYGVIVCPKGTKRFGCLDNLSNYNDIFEYNAENPLEGLWNWIPYSTSLVGKESKKRLWDFIGFAFYMNDDQMRLKPPGEWRAFGKHSDNYLKSMVSHGHWNAVPVRDQLYKRGSTGSRACPPYVLSDETVPLVQCSNIADFWVYVEHILSRAGGIRLSTESIAKIVPSFLLGGEEQAMFLRLLALAKDILCRTLLKGLKTHTFVFGQAFINFFKFHKGKCG